MWWRSHGASAATEQKPGLDRWRRTFLNVVRTKGFLSALLFYRVCVRDHLQLAPGLSHWVLGNLCRTACKLLLCSFLCDVALVWAFVSAFNGDKCVQNHSRQPGHGAGTNILPLFFIYSRPMSGIRMMIGCCRRWRTVILRKWLPCWVKREPVLPNKIVRAKLRKYNLNLSVKCMRGEKNQHWMCMPPSGIKNQRPSWKWGFLFHLKHNTFWKTPFWYSVFAVLHLKFHFRITKPLR